MQYSSINEPVLLQIVLSRDADGERGGGMRWGGVVHALGYLFAALTAEPAVIIRYCLSRPIVKIICEI